MPQLPSQSILSVMRSVFHGVAVVAAQTGRCIDLNPCLQQWLGTNVDDARDCSLELIFATSSLARVRELLGDVRGSNKPIEADEMELLAIDERFRWVDVRACPLDLPEGPAIALLLGPIAAPRSSAALDQRRDSLTGLLDREFAINRIASSLHGIRAADREFAVLFVDLDSFKQVNDTYGHLLGDRVLCEAARRMADCVRENDVVARFGGDEFLVIVDRVTDPSAVQPVIERIHAAMSEPIALPEGNVVLSLSIGVALPSPAHHSAEDLIAEADRAMYAAKRTTA